MILLRSIREGLTLYKDSLMQGSDITGATVGAIAGGAFGGPAGDIAGTAACVVIANVLKNIGNDISERRLSPREEVRVGAALIFAINKVQEQITNGYKLRNDDFFVDKPSERAASKEIVEGVLLAAQREHEEKKTRYYGNLLGNIAFSTGVSRAHADLLI